MMLLIVNQRRVKYLISLMSYLSEEGTSNFQFWFAINISKIINPTARSNIDYLFLSCNTNEVLNEVYNLLFFQGIKTSL